MKYLKYLLTSTLILLFVLFLGNKAFVFAKDSNSGSGSDNSGRHSEVAENNESDDDSNDESDDDSDEDNSSDDDSTSSGSNRGFNFGIGGKENEGLRHSSFEKIKIGGNEEKGLNKKQVIDRRYDWALTSLNNLYTRLSNVIDLLTTAGIDETDAKAKLDTAKTKIDDATAKVQALKDFIASVPAANASDSTTSALKISNTDLAKIRELAKTAKESIKTAHRALMDVKHAIALSIGLNDDENEDSSSDTPTVTN